MEFMLAQAADGIINEWINNPLVVFELKLDGTRAKAEIKKDKVVLHGRGAKSGKPTDYATQFPEIAEAIEDMNLPEGTILDGEIVIVDENNLPSFNLIQRRMNRVKNIEELMEELPATYIIFDVAAVGKLSADDLPYTERRNVLQSFKEKARKVAGRVDIIPNATSIMEKKKLWDLVVKHDMEGVMVKRIDGLYVNTRGKDWMKFKRLDTFDVIVTGFDWGTGRLGGQQECVDRNGVDIALRDKSGKPVKVFGSLNVSVYDDGKLVEIGDIGGGFTDEQRIELTRQYIRGKELKEKFVVEVECLGLGKKDGRLRMPQFLRVRDDKQEKDCTIDQFR